MFVQQLWRYPVKSMKGESLEEAALVSDGDVAGLAEREWAGRTLRIGGEDGPLIAVDSLRRRCVMTTYHPDTQVQDHHVLRKIVRDFGGELALDCAVKRPGRVCVGDPVTLI